MGTWWHPAIFTGEFLLWLSRLRTRYSGCEDAGSIPGLAQGVNDPAWPQAVAQVADVAQKLCCCGCGIGQQLQLQFDPLAQELPYARGAALKPKNKQK